MHGVLGLTRGELEPMHVELEPMRGEREQQRGELEQQRGEQEQHGKLVPHVELVPRKLLRDERQERYGEESRVVDNEELRDEGKQLCGELEVELRDHVQEVQSADLHG